MIQFSSLLLSRWLSRLLALLTGWALLLCLHTPLYAADPQLRYHSLADDLINAPITSYGLSLDQQGFIWMANQLDGLQRFDGYQLHTFAFAPSQLHALAPSISSVQIDRKNRVWVGSWGHGLGMWSADRQSFSRWPLPGHMPGQQAFTGVKPPLPAPEGDLSQVQTLFSDQQQRLWVGTTAGLYYLDANDRPTKLSTLIAPQLSALRFWQISQSDDQRLWLATSAGLFELSHDLTDLKRWTATAIPPFDHNQRNLEVRTVLPVKDGVWFATSEALYFLDHKKQQLRPLAAPQLALARIQKLTQLRDGSILIGSGNGLYQLKAAFSYRQQLHKLMEALDVRDILQDHNGLLWIATRHRGVFKLQLSPPQFRMLHDAAGKNWFEPGLHRIASQLYHQGVLWLGLENEVLSYHIEQQQWQQHRFPAEALVKLVQGLAADSSGKLYAATDKGLFSLQGRKGFVAEEAPFARHPELKQQSIMALSFSPDGMLNMSIWQQGLLRWQPDNPDQGAVLHPIATGIGNSILQIVPVDHILWLVSSNSGLYRLDTEDDSLRHFSSALSSVPQLPSMYLPCAWSDSTSQVWLCSDLGLLKLDIVNNQLQQFTSSSGLPDPRVIAIAASPAQPELISKSGKTIKQQNQLPALWLVTRRGLAELDRNSMQIRSYTDLNGTAPLLLEQRALSADGNGRFYLGSGQGVLSFLPKQLSAVHSTAPLVLTRLQLDRHTLWQVPDAQMRPLRLAPDSKNLQFYFSLLDYQHNRHQYRYRLLGLDAEWQHNGHQHSLTFSNLPAGHYQLEVEVTGSRQNTAPLKISFEVERHWWQYKLLWLLAALTLLVFSAALVRLRLDHLNRKAHKLNQLVAKRTADLASANKQLASQARTDYLTRLPNRLAFSEQYQTVLHHCQRTVSPLCLVLIDVDFFKQVNDNFGHDAGDLVLRKLAETMSARLRQQDVLARFGGEEFILLLPDTAVTGAQILCENLRLAVKQLQVPYQQQQLSVTATFGVVEINSPHNELSYWQQKADLALYQGKKNGRDQVVLYQDLTEHKD
ncbi:ligand-binding sensor domain-containing diguanylate cyclase [Rheinheimera sp. 4Y26]|uniref:ligand-binding sensor domain-containing diguanylate cyclase n=1 Tax=Rheinheimera sp. 4Y26 TaxID=2977811 RepID=UPI0021B0D899|nr:ligand-binding sensor domain-containing diguanylate cyclase [Rheinheimera sp. 4Y26]MCT6699177.1 diguanylate cyclase [Rheinheimera sp. 4Y26]